MFHDGTFSIGALTLCAAVSLATPDPAEAVAITFNLGPNDTTVEDIYWSSDVVVIAAGIESVFVEGYGATTCEKCVFQLGGENAQFSDNGWTFDSYGLGISGEALGATSSDVNGNGYYGGLYLAQTIDTQATPASDNSSPLFSDTHYAGGFLPPLVEQFGLVSTEETSYFGSFNLLIDGVLTGPGQTEATVLGGQIIIDGFELADIDPGGSGGGGSAPAPGGLLLISLAEVIGSRRLRA